MKQSNRDCKIVRDLLPSYIDDLTDEVTNEFINEHIADCPECAKFLSQMNGDIKLDVINQEKEIKYLKKIRRRVKQTIAIVSLIVIIVAACAVGYVYNKSKIQVNNYTFMKARYILENRGKDKNVTINGTFIAVIDEKGICRSVRVVEDGYQSYDLEEQTIVADYGIESHSSNIKIVDGKIHYNVNIWNGMTKHELEKFWTEQYKDIFIEEI